MFPECSKHLFSDTNKSRIKNIMTNASEADDVVQNNAIAIFFHSQVYEKLNLKMCLYVSTNAPAIYLKSIEPNKIHLGKHKNMNTTRCNQMLFFKAVGRISRIGSKPSTTTFL